MDSIPQPVLMMDNEVVSYQGDVALRNISLAIAAGEKVALVGPSGAGKTTLLRRLYQLRPNECAFIHQQHALVPQLSAFHNIFMGRLDQFSSIHNLVNLIRPNRKRVDEISPIARSLGLEDKLFTRVGQLSGGQQQRVGVGRALYRGGSILMADEPVSSLDSIQGQEIVKIITNAGRTVVAALHSIELSRQFFARIIGLKDGSILFDLPTRQVSPTLLRELYG